MEENTMNAEELRIGNLVAGGKIIHLHKNGFIEYEVDEGLSFGSSGELVGLKPIQLTPEWLERFGFEIQIGTPANSGARYIEFESSEQQFRVYVNTNKDDEKESSLHLAAGNGWFPCLVEFSYVHTFQNIFHSLTGQELTLKP